MWVPTAPACSSQTTIPSAEGPSVLSQEEGAFVLGPGRGPPAPLVLQLLLRVSVVLAHTHTLTHTQTHTDSHTGSHRLRHSLIHI